MHVSREAITVTTDGSGDATGYSSLVEGRVLAIYYIKDDYENTATFLITTETTGETLWSQANVSATARHNIGVAVMSPVAGALMYEGTNPVVWPCPVGRERIKIVVSAGGNIKSGTFHIIVEGRIAGG